MVFCVVHVEGMISELIHGHCSEMKPDSCTLNLSHVRHGGTQYNETQCEGPAGAFCPLIPTPGRAPKRMDTLHAY